LFDVVDIRLMNFRSHVTISTKEFPVHTVSSVHNLMAETKVDDFHVSRIVEDNVFEL